MKQRIYFLAPQVKWWTYFYYKEITDYLIRNHSDIYNIYFCNSLRDYIKLHFIRSDIIFSVVPFFFKPLWTKNYFFNLHWNHKINRKGGRLGAKLLYLAELNLWFCDKIVLTSFYLADKLKFTKKQLAKTEILPNFIQRIAEKNQQLEENNFNFLTITSFQFYEKWKWIINLWKVIAQLWNRYPDKIINFTIVWNENNANFLAINSQFEAICFPKNVNIVFKWWLKKESLKSEFLSHNTFLYWTFLDNTPWVVLDAINYNLKVFVNNFEGFQYFLDEHIICNDESIMVEKILQKQYKNNTNILYIEDICNAINTLINKSLI